MSTVRRFERAYQAVGLGGAAGGTLNGGDVLHRGGAWIHDAEAQLLALERAEVARALAGVFENELPRVQASR